VSTKNIAPANYLWPPERVRFRRDGPRIAKCARISGQKLLAEARWIMHLPAELRSYFPEIYEIRERDEECEYVMEYVPWPNLAETLTQHPHEAERVQGTIQKAVMFVHHKLHAGSRSPAGTDHLTQHYLVKFRSRVAAARGTAAALDTLYGRTDFEVNGVLCRAPGLTLEWIAAQPGLAARLQPVFLRRTHGDFKLDNILSDLDSGAFKLIDPRGVSATGEDMSDSLEDFAKLRTSTLGFYDLAVRGWYDVSVEGFRIALRQHPEAAAACKAMQWLDMQLLSVLATLGLDEEDPHWRERLLFLTAALMIANSPFQLVDDSTRSIEMAVFMFAMGSLILERVAANLRGSGGGE
jgi:hypothetical protein